MTKKYAEELEQAYTMITVMEEAQRCLLCQDAPCSQSCPAGTDPAKFIRSVRFRNFKGAAETIRENNALGAVCARVCRTDAYCQKACSRCGIDRPINIGGIQRFVTDFENKAGMSILKKGQDNGKKIAVIGSGPAGLQAAASLLQLGYAVDIYEKKAEAGGYLRYGIPEYRLPNAVVDQEIAKIADLGAQFKFNVTVGKDIAMDDIKAQYDAVLAAVGLTEPKILPKYADNPYVETAVEFLARVKEAQGEIEVPQNVLVIGGSEVAMDVSTTLRMLGSRTVTNIIRREFSDLHTSKTELRKAQELGVTIIDGYVTEKVEGNTVTFKHKVIPGELKITADKIILAVGQEACTENLGFTLVNNEADFDGCRIGETNVFISGDIARGDKTVVAAVKKGKEAAEAIHASLGGRK